MVAPALKTCRLHELLSRVELCPTTACALWEPGDAMHDGHCVVEDLDLEGRPEAAAWLLRIRKEIEVVGSSEEREAAVLRFAEARDLIVRSSRAPRRH